MQASSCPAMPRANGKAQPARPVEHQCPSRRLRPLPTSTAAPQIAASPFLEAAAHASLCSASAARTQADPQDCLCITIHGMRPAITMPAKWHMPYARHRRGGVGGFFFLACLSHRSSRARHPTRFPCNRACARRRWSAVAWRRPLKGRIRLRSGVLGPADKTESRRGSDRSCPGSKAPWGMARRERQHRTSEE